MRWLSSQNLLLKETTCMIVNGAIQDVSIIFGLAL